MPTDLNQFDLEKLTEKVASLKPGQAILTNEGLVIRKRQNTSGYDCGVGPGGDGKRRAMTPREAASDLLQHSAKLIHPDSLGGAVSFDDYEKAIESVKAGKAITTGPSPALKEIRRLALKASLGSYRSRADTAKRALAKGDVPQAVRQLEAIIEHAGMNGRGKDAERAQSALRTLTDNHDYKFAPELTSHTFSVRHRDGQHIVYRNGKEVGSRASRDEAESLKSYLVRQAARQEDVAAIDNELDSAA